MYPLLFCFFFFFFFKQKTAYEMRISDWSSDVCSSDLKKAFAEAREHARIGKRTLLFVDEIHRFNRAQQDGFLPYVEDGTVTLIGATTENPSFELNAALLSRAQVLILYRLGHEALAPLPPAPNMVKAAPLPPPRPP